MAAALRGQALLARRDRSAERAATAPLPTPTLSTLARRVHQAIAALRPRPRATIWSQLADELANARTCHDVESALLTAATHLLRRTRIELLPPPRTSGNAQRHAFARNERTLHFAGQCVGVMRVHSARPANTTTLDRLALVAAPALAAIRPQPATTRADANRRRPVLATEPPSVIWRRDQVTGLPGPDFLDAVLASLQDSTPPRPFALLIVAVDHLAHVRETLGHEFADAAVGITARVVRATLRASDPIVRLDDNSLAVVLPGANRHNALRVSQTLQNAIAEAGLTSSTPRPLTASLGLACAPEDGDYPAALRAAALDNLTSTHSAST